MFEFVCQKLIQKSAQSLFQNHITVIPMTIKKDEIVEDEDIETETYKKYRRVTVTLPDNIAEQAEHYAEEHNMKRSQVMALAIEKGLGDENRIFKKLNRIEALVKKNNRMVKSKEESKLEDETPEEKVLTNEERQIIAELLTDCNSTFSPFEIQGEDGFLAQVQERQIVGSIWTDEALQTLAKKLSVGYDDWYFNKPEPQELMDMCAEVMELSEDQKNKLTEYFAKLQELEVEHTKPQKQKSRKLQQREGKAEETTEEE